MTVIRNNVVSAMDHIVQYVRQIQNTHDWFHVRIELYNGKSDELVATFDSRRGGGEWQL